MIGIATFLSSMLLTYLIIVPGLKNNVTERAIKANDEIIQLYDNMLAYVSDYTENLALFIEKDRAITDYFSDPKTRNRFRASLSLDNLISHPGNIRCAVIQDENGVILDSMNRVDEKDYALIESDWYQGLRSEEHGRGISSIYTVQRNDMTYYTGAYLKKIHYANESYTYTVFYTINHILYNSGAIARGDLDYCVLIDTAQNAFYGIGDQKWADIVDEYIANNGDVRNGSKNVNGGICFVNASIQSKWGVASFVSEKTMLRSINGFIVSVFFILLAFLVITLCLLPRSISGIVNPIRKLSDAMSVATLDNTDLAIGADSNDEIGDLSRAFNTMLRNLKDKIDIIAEKEKVEQRMKFGLLINQIDPHFIYNTLNNINYLAKRGRSEDIIVVNSALMDILHDRLRVNDIEITDAIENEIRVVEQYVLIQRHIYGGKFNLIWNVDESMRLKQIPKNIIQPLVENALFHGLIDEESGELQGRIEVTISCDSEKIIIEVYDDGCGIDSDRLNQLRTADALTSPEERGNNIGIANIRGRLSSLYGNEDCVSIESRYGEWTRVTLTINSGYPIA